MFDEDMRGLVLLAIVAVLAAIVLLLAARQGSRTEGMRDLTVWNGDPNTAPRPYFVQLIMFKDESPPTQDELSVLGESSFCGGVLIEKDVVLTAAHCLRYSNLQDIMCAVGFDNVSTPQFIRPKKIIIFEYYTDADNGVFKRDISKRKYKRTPGGGDIALIFLERNASAEPLRLSVVPDYKDILDETFLFMGRGRTSHTPILSATLQTYEAIIDYPITPNKGFDKTDLYPPSVYFETGTIRVRGKISVDVCIDKGDSGGPLIRFENGKPTVLGISSFVKKVLNEKCDYAYNVIPYTPVYAALTYVPFYARWVNETIKKYRDGPKKAVIELSTAEIRHVICQARLQTLRELQALIGKDWWDGTTPLDVAAYFATAGAYAGLLALAPPPKRKEAEKLLQLTVAWAGASGPHTEETIRSIVCDPAADASTSITRFKNVAFFVAGGKLRNELGTQTFDLANIGGAAAWTSVGTQPPPSAWPLNWPDPPVARDLPFHIPIGPADVPGATHILSRPLREKMHCDFVTNLRKYLALRRLRPWLTRYLQFVHADKREHRLSGMFEYEESPPTGSENLDPTTGKARSSYVVGDSKTPSVYNKPPSIHAISQEEEKTDVINVSDASYVDLPDFDFSDEEEEQTDPSNVIGFLSGTANWWVDAPKISDAFEPPAGAKKPQYKDPAMFWMQLNGDPWPDLQEKALYERYAWVAMEDGGEPITFDQALFLSKTNELLGRPSSPVLALTWLKTSLYKWFPTAELKTLNKVAEGIKHESIRENIVHESLIRPVYSVGETVFALQNQGTIAEQYVPATVYAVHVIPKTSRELRDKRDDLSKRYAPRALKYWYPVEYTLELTDDEFWGNHIEFGQALVPRSIQPIHDRFAGDGRLQECAHKTAKTPAPADNKKKPPPDEGGNLRGGAQELDALLAEIWKCI